jgi:subtilisin family serine protease/subtilase family serine protease
MRQLLFRALVALVWVWPVDSAWAQPRGPRQIATVTVDGHPAVAGEVLVALREDAPPGAWDDLRLLGDGDVPASGQSRIRRLRSRSLGVAALRARLAAHPAVRYVEPNWVITLSESGDPLTPQLWGLINIGQSVNGMPGGRIGADIGADSAWMLSTGSTDYVVAIVDSGVDYTHPDLRPNLWAAPSAFTVTVAGQTISCPAGTYGFDAIGRTCDPMDDHNHGTHVAGTIGAAGANGVGVAGVNWTARMMALRFVDQSGHGTTADAIAALEFAIAVRRHFSASGQADVRVLSNSWGTRAYSQALADTIAAAAAENMLFVAAAGNSGYSNDLLPMYPASYALPNVIAVAATTNTDGRAWFSNFGVNSVHLGAPGVDILSTVRGGAYGFSSGTSMAAPHVSGVAALVLSRCALDTAALKAALLDTVERSAALAGVTVTGGRLDAYSALRSCLGPPDAPAALVATAGDGRVDLAWGTAAGATGYIIHRSIAAGGPYAPASGTLTSQSFTDSSVSNGATYYYVVRGVNAAGEGPSSNEAHATPKVPPDLVISALTAPSTAGAGASMSVSATTRNQGAGTSGPTVTRFLLSANTQPDAGDAVLGVLTVPGLAPGGTFAGAVSLVVPPGITTDTYYLVALSDADNAETEPSETNNELARSIRVGPDLGVTALTVPAMAGPGDAIVISETTRNQGGGAAGATATRFYLSANSTLDGEDILLAGARNVPALAAGETSTGSSTVQIPAQTAAGSYYLIARADAGEAVAETSESNNNAARSLKVGADLVVTLAVPSVGGAGAALTVTDTTSNLGTASAGTSATRFYLSANSTLSADDVPLGARAAPALAPGESSSVTAALQLPATLPTGIYYVIARADADDAVVETNEGNNNASRSVSVGPDLRISAMTVPYAQQAGGSSMATLTIENRGGGNAAASRLRFFLSTNTRLEDTDLALDVAVDLAGLAAGGQVVTTAALPIPVNTAAGLYYVFARVDADGDVNETQESNNTLWRTVSVSVP